VAAHVGRRALSVGFGVAALVAGVTGGVTGTLWLASVAVLAIAATVAVYRAPDFVFEAPEPAVERGSIVVDGMTDKEVMRRFAIVTERERYKQEKAEDERKRRERKAKSRGRF